jgi:hypothetical protein
MEYPVLQVHNGLLLSAVAVARWQFHMHGFRVYRSDETHNLLQAGMWDLGFIP